MTLTATSTTSTSTRAGAAAPSDDETESKLSARPKAILKRGKKKKKEPDSNTDEDKSPWSLTDAATDWAARKTAEDQDGDDTDDQQQQQQQQDPPTGSGSEGYAPANGNKNKQQQQQASDTETEGEDEQSVSSTAVLAPQENDVSHHKSRSPARTTNNNDDNSPKDKKKKASKSTLKASKSTLQKNLMVEDDGSAALALLDIRNSDESPQEDEEEEAGDSDGDDGEEEKEEEQKEGEPDSQDVEPQSTAAAATQSMPKNRRMTEPPGDLSLGQKMTWHARQGRKKSAAFRKKEPKTSAPSNGNNGSSKRELENLSVASLLPGETPAQYQARMDNYQAALAANASSNSSEAHSNIMFSYERRKKRATVPFAFPDQASPRVTSSSTKASSASASSPSAKLVLEPTRVIDVGARVYCEFPENKRYYWGKVVRKDRKPKSRFFMYDVSFDDGDKAEAVSSTRMYTEEEYDKEVASQKAKNKAKEKEKYKGDEKDKAVLGRPKGSTTKVLQVKAPQKKAPAVEAASSRALKAYTPHSLWRERCRKCPKCLQPDCSRCASCRGNQEKRDPETYCCLQKMCQAIDLPLKAQDATCGFPEGWKFAFDDDIKASDNVKDRAPSGFALFPPPPNTRKYFCVERAVNHCPKALAGVDIAQFYEYIGLSPHSEEKVKPSKKRVMQEEWTSMQGSPALHKHQKDPTINSRARRLKDLYESRCTKCTLCIKPTCKNCNSCKRNASAINADPMVCFQKMCCQISLAKKKQDALGLPPGWKFYYIDPRHLSWQSTGDNAGLAGLVLLSPTGAKYASVESASAVLEKFGIVSNMASLFYSHVGCTIQPSHPLQDKPFRQKWVDVEGKTQVIYGRISGVDVVPSGKHYTVEFNPESRALVNVGGSQNLATVPEKHKICESFAYGGCIDMNPQASLGDLIPHYCFWNVPDFRHESSSTDDNGMFVPKLTVHFRDFQLVITANTSTIPNSGNGVFISCTRLTASGGNLRLKAGELVDLGVYAPFRAKDTKHQHTFYLKNFLFGGICGEWTFDTTSEGDTCLFDITDDTTGELHDLAKRHIPAYVNETDGKMAPSVSAQHDPAGSVHYLLGHYDEVHGPLTLKADGIAREVFIDYGKNYEDFRIRKDYSRLPREEAEARHRELLETDHLDELDQLMTMDAEEVTGCIYFMCNDWYHPERQYPVAVATRALLALMLIKKKVGKLMERLPPDNLHRRGNRDNNYETEKGPRAKLELEFQKAHQLLRCLYKFWNCCYGLKETLMSEKVYISSLEFIIGNENFKEMTPESLEAKIMGN